MNQTMFVVPDPLVVHVLLLTHEFIYNVICLLHSWYPQCDGSMFFMCPKHTDFPLELIAVGWSWQMLNC